MGVTGTSEIMRKGHMTAVLFWDLSLDHGKLVKAPGNNIMSVNETNTPPLRKPDWLKTVAAVGGDFDNVREVTRKFQLHTVCDASHCPNIRECWSERSATFMILGDICTRHCRFCAVNHGDPKGRTDASEPIRVAHAIKELDLRYAVITSVTRDDLEDGGASAFAETVRAIHSASESKVELLIPDLSGNTEALQKVASSAPEVMGHNIETVERLQGQVRDLKSSYARSISLLTELKDLYPNMVTKSSMMLGVGETLPEVIRTMSDLRDAGVDAIAIGQYLKPKGGSLPIVEYIPPEMFQRIEEQASDMGFRYIACGPIVRTSYRAEKILDLIGGA
jgi:lipoic acid synthetase